MQAIVYHEYGSPNMLKLAEIEKPIPQANEVLVKIEAAAVNAADWHLLRGEPFLVRPDSGLFKPKYKILGADIAGRVEAVGAAVTRFQPGAEVFGDISDVGRGGFAEYVAVPETALAHKPTKISFEETAAVPLAAMTALQGLRDKGHLQAGQQVLINGASGGVGTFAVQIAKAFGAEVTAVTSTRKIELVRSLGADHVIDYTQTDFTNTGTQYDLIFDTVANRSVAEYKRALKPNGIFVTTGFSLGVLFLGPWIVRTERKKLLNLMMKPKTEDLVFLKSLLEKGQLKPVIDKRYPLSDVPAALNYIGEGHAKGKVIITMDGQTQNGNGHVL